MEKHLGMLPHFERTCRGEAFDLFFGWIGSAAAAEFLLDGVDLLLLSGGGGVPALFRHAVVDLVLHGERFVHGSREGGVHLGGRGFDRAVEHQVTFALDAQQKIF